jgi:hypothetical protein
MVKLTDLLNKIIKESFDKKLNEQESIIFEETELFLELANPDAAYEYKKVGKNIWEFNDRFGNTLGVRYDEGSKYFESYYLMRDKKGQEVRVFDYETNKNYLDPTSFQGNSDEHRSDTICKILLDEILPEYLLNKKSQIVKLHPLNDYRFKIFYKCAEVCKEKYPQIEIKKVGKEIHLINK